jgi:hypothetical protein
MNDPLNTGARRGRRAFCRRVYAQWEWMVTELKYVSVEFLREMIRNDAPVGATILESSDTCRRIIRRSTTRTRSRGSTLIDPRKDDAREGIRYADYNRMRVLKRLGGQTGLACRIRIAIHIGGRWFGTTLPNPPPARHGEIKFPPVRKVQRIDISVVLKSLSCQASLRVEVIATELKLSH